MRINPLKKLVDEYDKRLPAQDRPHINDGEQSVLEFDLVTAAGVAIPYNESDTFALYADTDYIHQYDAGVLADDYAGAITAIALTGLAKTPPSTGFLVLENADSRDRVAYTDCDAGVFTVDATLIGSYTAGDACYIEDQLCLYAGNNSFNDVADRADVSAADGKLCVRYSADFNGKVTKANTILYVELWRYRAGQTVPEKLLVDTMYCDPTLIEYEGQPGSNAPEYYTAAQVNALIRLGMELQFSVDDVSYHATQTGADKYFQFRYPEGEWSPGILLPEGFTPSFITGSFTAADLDENSLLIINHTQGDIILPHCFQGTYDGVTYFEAWPNGVVFSNNQIIVDLSNFYGDYSVFGTWRYAFGGCPDTTVWAKAFADFEFDNDDLIDGILTKTATELGVTGEPHPFVYDENGEFIPSVRSIKWSSGTLTIDLSDQGAIPATWKLKFK